MNYTLNQLQLFVKVAETKSISKTAELLHLTQPAVSIQLKNFQQQFDIPLIEIIHKKVYVTPFGKEIVAAAQNILNEVHAIDEKSMHFKGKLTGTLKISVVSTGKYVIPYFLHDFLEQHPGVELNLDVSNKASVIEDLQNNDTDFALVSIIPPNMKLNKITLMENTLHLVGKRSKKNKQNLGKNFLEHISLIFREHGSATRTVMEQFLNKNKISYRKKIELTSNEAVKQAVLAGLGYSVMPLIGLKYELLDKELEIIPVKGLPITTSWNLIWLKQKKLNPVAEAFIQVLANEKEKIIKQYFSWVQTFLHKPH